MVASRFEIVYSPGAIEDLRQLRAYDQRAITDGIDGTLTASPTTETRSTVKLMTQPFWSQYRLRVGEFRVFYNVYNDEDRVRILRVLYKGTEVTPQALP